MDAPEKYFRELRSELGANPTWLPTDVVELGTLGSIVDGRFVAAGRLADLAIPIAATRPGAGQPLKKQRGMKMRLGSNTQARVQGLEASAEVSFEATSEYAWAFAAAGARKTELENILEVARLVLEAHKSGAWKRSWRLVTSVWHVDRLTVLVSRSKRVKARVQVSGTVADPVDVLVAETAEFEYASEDFFAVQNAKGVTPLYGLHKLQGLLDPELRAIASGGTADADLALAEAHDEPFTAAE